VAVKVDHCSEIRATGLSRSTGYRHHADYIAPAADAIEAMAEQAKQRPVPAKIKS